MNIGLRYLFGAKDDGVEASMRSTRTGLADIEEGADRSTAGAKRLGLALGSLGLIKLDQISDGIDSLGRGVDGFVSSVQGGELDSAIDMMAIDFDKGFAGMAAKAGLFGKDMRAAEREIFGAAFALNEDAASAGEAFLALKKQGITAQDLLGDEADFKDVIRVLDVTGLEAAELAEVFQSLSKSYSFGAGGAREFLDELTQQSTAYGLGTEAFATLTSQMETMDSAFSKTFMSEGPDAVRGAAKGMLELAAAMVEATGVDPQSAMTQSIELFSKLQEEANVLPSMMAGMSSEFGNIANEIGIIKPGGFQEALEMIKDGAKDPASFAKSMGSLYDMIAKEGGPKSEVMLQRMSAMISENLGPDFVFLAESGMNVARVLEGLPDPAEAGIKSLRELGREGHRTGLGLEGGLERVRMAFDDTFKNISDVQTGAFVEKQTEAYGKLGKRLTEWGDRKGPLGFVITRMSLFSRVGAAALLPMNEMGAAIGMLGAGMVDLATTMLPLVALLSSMGLNFGAIGAKLAFLVKGPIAMVRFALYPLIALLGTLSTPVLVVIGVVAALAAAFGGLYLAMTGKLGKKLKTFGDWVGEKLSAGFGKAADFLNGLSDRMEKLDPKKLVDAMMGGIRKAVDAVRGAFSGGGDRTTVDSISGAASAFWEALVRVFGESARLASGLVREISGRIYDAVSNFDWRQSATGVVDGIYDAVSSLSGRIYDAVSSFDWSRAATGVVDGFVSAVGSLSGRIHDAVSAGTSFRDRIADWVLLTVMTIDWKGLFTRAFDGARAGVGMITGLLATATSTLRSIKWGELGDKIGSSVMDSVIKIGSSVMDSVISALRAVGTGILAVGYMVWQLLQVAWDTMSTKQFWVDLGNMLIERLRFAFTLTQSVRKFVVGLGIGIMRSLIGALFGEAAGDAFATKAHAIFDKVFGWMDSAFELFVVGLRYAGAAVAFVVKWIGKGLVFLWGVVKWVGEKIGVVMHYVWEGLKIVWEGLKIVGKVAMAIGGKVVSMFKFVWGAIKKVGEGIWFVLKKVGGMFAWLWNKAGEGIDQLKAGIGHLWTSMQPVFDFLKGVVDMAIAKFGQIRDTVYGMAQYFRSLWDVMFAGGLDMVLGIVDLVVSRFQGMKAVLTGVWDSVLDVFRQAWSVIEKAFGGIRDVLFGLAGKFGLMSTVKFQAESEPVGDDLADREQKSSLKKLVAMEDKKEEMRHLSTEFAGQNDLLRQIRDRLVGGDVSLSAGASARRPLSTTGAPARRS